MNKNNIKPCCWCQRYQRCPQAWIMRKNVENVKSQRVNAYVVGYSLACKSYYKQFRPGDRVLFKYYESDYSENEVDDTITLEYSPDEVKGTVIRWSKRKVGIFLDKEICIHGKTRRLVYVYPKYYGKGRQEVKSTYEKIDPGKLEDIIYQAVNWSNEVTNEQKRA